ncbi:unnamed protein product [Meganyctiphanes norvegica]|uniref:Uncharacterized protein n=1 Tax=Meganyctiphanes norvegica TaxID=48144 RepID=A0AAV2Q296_MEGNR
MMWCLPSVITSKKNRYFCFCLSSLVVINSASISFLPFELQIFDTVEFARLNFSKICLPVFPRSFRSFICCFNAGVILLLRIFFFGHAGMQSSLAILFSLSLSFLHFD